MLLEIPLLRIFLLAHFSEFVFDAFMLIKETLSINRGGNSYTWWRNFHRFFQEFKDRNYFCCQIIQLDSLDISLHTRLVCSNKRSIIHCYHTHTVLRRHPSYDRIYQNENKDVV